ncbi:MAG TPA: DUF423 domain-containing protein [Flavipsychrobacter sp.]|nr:DUF423 domain-containing protein [Flavipsychrobacter sp.]
MNKTGIIAGILFAGTGVILGAFGAHALKQVLDIMQLSVFETGVRYQMYHSFALILAGILYRFYPGKPLSLAASFFMIGILLFSGSLYMMTVLKINGQVGLGGLGILTPIGGVFFILGWLMMLWGVLKKENG